MIFLNTITDFPRIFYSVDLKQPVRVFENPLGAQLKMSRLICSVSCFYRTSKMVEAISVCYSNCSQQTHWYPYSSWAVNHIVLRMASLSKPCIVIQTNVFAKFWLRNLKKNKTFFQRQKGSIAVLKKWCFVLLLKCISVSQRLMSILRNSLRNFLCNIFQ